MGASSAKVSASTAKPAAVVAVQPGAVEAGMFLTYGRTGETRTRQGLSYGRPFYPYGRPYTYELPAVGVWGARKL